MLEAYFKELERGLEDTEGDKDLNGRVIGLNMAIKEAVMVTLPVVNKRNKRWITEHTLEMAKQKREMKQRRQEPCI